MSFYQSDGEIEALVRAFETCRIDKAEFRHRHHLAVAVWYVEMLGREAALERMRAGLLRFIEHHGVDPKKYSEEITVFWIDWVVGKLNEYGPEASLFEKCNRILAASDADRGGLGR
ncbi:MAG TPA: hypothetical protein VEV42_04020 [Pyrinomonadaceae bacterium]|nr:hypothetical protein [Pyrinomonadaceae bacterium]